MSYLPFLPPTSIMTVQIGLFVSAAGNRENGVRLSRKFSACSCLSDLLVKADSIPGGTFL